MNQDLKYPEVGVSWSLVVLLRTIKFSVITWCILSNLIWFWLHFFPRCLFGLSWRNRYVRLYEPCRFTSETWRTPIPAFLSALADLLRQFLVSSLSQGEMFSHFICAVKKGENWDVSLFRSLTAKVLKKKTLQLQAALLLVDNKSEKERETKRRKNMNNQPVLIVRW